MGKVPSVVEFEHRRRRRRQRVWPAVVGGFAGIGRPSDGSESGDAELTTTGARCGSVLIAGREHVTLSVLRQ